MVAADINGDGRPDIILTSRQGSGRNLLMTALNNGNGYSVYFSDRRNHRSAASQETGDYA